MRNWHSTRKGYRRKYLSGPDRQTWQVLAAMCRRVLAHRDSDAQLMTLCREIRRRFHVSRVVILWLNDAGSYVVIVSGVGLPLAYLRSQAFPLYGRRRVTPFGRNLLRVFHTGRPVVCRNRSLEREYQRFLRGETGRRVFAKEYALVPLQAHGRVFAVVQLANEAEDGPLAADDLRFLTALSDVLAVTVLQARQSMERRLAEERIARVEEEVRYRNARDIHDGLGQHLTGLHLTARLLDRGAHTHAPRKTSAARRVARLARDATTAAQSLIRGLHPRFFSGGGLRSAFDEIAARTRRDHGILCTVFVSRTLPSLSEETAIHLYRIAQEAVHNAVKHAKPKRITITLRARQGGVVLIIEDDGVGLPERLYTGGMGIVSMKYRANLMRGAFEMKNRARGGTRVACQVDRHPGSRTVGIFPTPKIRRFPDMTGR